MMLLMMTLFCRNCIWIFSCCVGLLCFCIDFGVPGGAGLPRAPGVPTNAICWWFCVLLRYLICKLLYLFLWPTLELICKLPTIENKQRLLYHHHMSAMSCHSESSGKLTLSVSDHLAVTPIVHTSLDGHNTVRRCHKTPSLANRHGRPPCGTVVWAG